jgi:hypothetical protein
VVVTSAHGFGHAARSSAVINALSDNSSLNCHFHIISGTPQWFFEESLDPSFTYQYAETDVGLVQRTPLIEDLDATAHALDAFYPIDPHRLAEIRKQVPFDVPIDAVLCDIAPLGILLAEQWGCPSILLENFTWPWIYRSYLDPPHALLRAADYIEQLLDQATVHIRCEPFCPADSDDLAQCHTVTPVARSPRMDKSEVLTHLNIDEESHQPVIMASMGGIPDHFDCITQLQKLPYTFILAGSHPKMEWQKNCLLLPHQSDWYHPDLVHASDLLVGKLGYSTLAEVIDARAGFAYLTRPHFPESPCLKQYVDQHLPSAHLSADDFYAGEWDSVIQQALQQRSDTISIPSANGSVEVASIIASLLR